MTKKIEHEKYRKTIWQRKTTNANKEQKILTIETWTAKDNIIEIWRKNIIDICHLKHLPKKKQMKFSKDTCLSEKNKCNTYFKNSNEIC